VYNKRQKDQVKKQIDSLTWDLIEATLKQHGKSEKLEEVRRFQQTNIRPFFLWRLNFADVFVDRSGFDIIIANPPYVEHKKLKPFTSAFKEHYKAYSGTADLYVYFYELGLDILADGGVLSFISSNKFMRTSYGAKLRSLLASYHIYSIIDFTKVHVFEALVASCVIIVSKERADGSITVSFVDDRLATTGSLYRYIDTHHSTVPAAALTEKIWQLKDRHTLELKTRIESGSRRIRECGGIRIFRGVTTGCNKAFVIDQATRTSLLTADGNNTTVIKPLLQGRDIRKWSYRELRSFLLFIPWHFPLHEDPSISGASKGAERAFRKEYTAVYDYLSQFRAELKSRNTEETGIRYEWYALQRCAASYYPEFDKTKVIWGLTADKWAFAYDEERHYLPSNGYILTSEKISLKYLLALLNSKLMQFYFGFIGIMTAGGAYTLKHETIREFPIKDVPQSQQESVIDLVDGILRITGQNNYSENQSAQAAIKEYEKRIDEQVYKLYGLTSEEIDVVERQIGT